MITLLSSKINSCTGGKNQTLLNILDTMHDDIAVIIMVDTNLEQRESLLPSENEWAYRMKLEANDNEL